jgi:hypothetical protein
MKFHSAQSINTTPSAMGSRKKKSKEKLFTAAILFPLPRLARR